MERERDSQLLIYAHFDGPLWSFMKVNVIVGNLVICLEEGPKYIFNHILFPFQNVELLHFVGYPWKVIGEFFHYGKNNLTNPFYIMMLNR